MSHQAPDEDTELHTEELIKPYRYKYHSHNIIHMQLTFHGRQVDLQVSLQFGAFALKKKVRVGEQHEGTQ